MSQIKCACLGISLCCHLPDDCDQFFRGVEEPVVPEFRLTRSQRWDGPAQAPVCLRGTRGPGKPEAMVNQPAKFLLDEEGRTGDPRGQCTFLKRQSQRHRSPPSPENRKRFPLVHRFAVVSTRPRHASLPPGKRNQPRISTRRRRGGEAKKGVKFGNLVGTARTDCRHRLALEAAAMWWSRCSPPSSLGEANLHPGWLRGPAVALQPPDRPASQPEWPAGAAGAGCHRLSPPFAAHSR